MRRVKSTRINVRASEETRARLKRITEAEQMSQANLIEFLLRAYESGRFTPFNTISLKYKG